LESLVIQCLRKRFAEGFDMWTDENRARYDRSKLRYPSDLTDGEWALIEPLIPPAKPGGNKRTIVERDIVNGLMYILSTGCQWASLPRDFPPRSTVNDYFRRWEQDRTLDHMHHALYVLCRELAEREASPTAAIIDSQSVKSAEKGGVSIDPHGYDAGKKIKGKKRHVLVDTQGLLLHAIVSTAQMQDRDGGILLMATLFGLYPFLRTLYADGGYQGPQFRQAMQQICEQINVEIVKRSDAGKFVVLPKRWIVERTIGWLNRCRRLAKDWECLNRNGLAFLRWASVRLMVRKLCQDSK
jgi:transposase